MILQIPESCWELWYSELGEYEPLPEGARPELFVRTVQTADLDIINRKCPIIVGKKRPSNEKSSKGFGLI